MCCYRGLKLQNAAILSHSSWSASRGSGVSSGPRIILERARQLRVDRRLSARRGSLSTLRRVCCVRCHCRSASCNHRKGLDSLAVETLEPFCQSYQVPITTKRPMMSVNPAIARAAAIMRNNLELIARSELLLKRTVSRMANKIPATANKVGQSGLRWLIVSHFAKRGIVTASPVLAHADSQPVIFRAIRYFWYRRSRGDSDWQTACSDRTLTATARSAFAGFCPLLL